MKGVWGELLSRSSSQSLPYKLQFEQERNPMERCILHCDMNNFYASVECMLDPSLRGRPVAVCGEVEERRGIVLAKNYEAKAYGVMTG